MNERELRLKLARFSAALEQILRVQSGGRPGAWQTLTPHGLVTRVTDEAHELAGYLDSMHRMQYREAEAGEVIDNKVVSRGSDGRVMIATQRQFEPADGELVYLMTKAAEAANYIFMLVDVCGCLEQDPLLGDQSGGPVMSLPN